MKKVLLSIYLLLLVFVSAHAYLRIGFPYTHDGENHLARFANYKIALKEGQLPPRFAPNLMNHYGYPVFNYNYPLANILSLPFSAVKMNYQLTFKVIVIGSLFLGAIGIWLWLRQFSFSTQAKMVGVTGYLLHPYLFSTLTYRGNIGEILAIALIPWVLWSIEMIRNQKRVRILFPIIAALFCLSHNVTVLIALPFFAIYTVIRLKKDWTQWRALILYSLLTVTLVSWFWLPALLEKDQIILGNDRLAQQATKHFPTLHQLLFSPQTFGFSFPSPVDSLSFQIGISHLFVLAVVVIICLKKTLLKKNFNEEKSNRFFIGSIFIVFLLQLPFMAFLWKSIPGFTLIQFPWRLMILTTVLFPYLFAYFWSNTTKLLKMIVVILITGTIVTYLRLQPADFFSRKIVDYDAFPQSTSTLNENLPKTFTLNDIGGWQPSPKIIGKGEVEIPFWNGSKHEYLVRIHEPSIVIEPTMYFLGWETKITGDMEKMATYIFTDETQGRIAFELPVGEYILSTQFTQNTPARKIGNTLFIIGMFGYLALLFNLFLKKHHATQKN